MEVYPDDPAVYHYTYSVDDDYTGAKIFADEERDGGDTHGMYEVSHQSQHDLLNKSMSQMEIETNRSFEFDQEWKMESLFCFW